MATQIIMIVGEGGFNSLYTRALSLTQTTFPWLTATSQSSTPVNRFAELIMSLDGQPYEQANSANNLLLTSFTDILASLIGEDLTINILQIAWGIDCSNISWEETKNE